MRKLICMGLLLFLLPGIVLADCVDLRRSTSYYVQGAHDIIVYSRLTPVAYINVPWCNISTDSTVQITTAYLCDSDKIIVDGVPCPIFTVRSSSFQN
jgi:hypothetical protein